MQRKTKTNPRGAGRKPRPVPRKAITVRVEPEHFDAFRMICKDRGKSQADQITDWIVRES